jgi:hypothetical protein
MGVKPVGTTAAQAGVMAMLSVFGDSPPGLTAVTWY